jgi:signal transduction histidine kinase
MPIDMQETPDAKVRLEEARFLADASGMLASSFDYRATLAAVARRAVPVLADICIVEILEAGTLRRLAVVAADAARVAGADPDVAAGDDEMAARREALQTREGVLVDAAARSTIVVPLVARDAVLGVITLIAAESGRRYSRASLAMARDLAARAAMSIDHAHLFESEQRAIRAREDVLSFVSHDLRNPLMGILLTIETLLRAAPREERRKGWKQLERIQRGALQMQGMIDDVLDLASLDAGRLIVDAGACEVRHLFDDAFTALEAQAAAKGVSLRFEPPDGGVAVRCDRARVVQVLSILVGNSIKFTPSGGAITVRARATAGQVRFSVSDTGPDVVPLLRSRIFERLWQADAAARKEQGLGLYLAKGLVEAQGGTIAVDGADGGGLTFSFGLPIVPAPSAHTPRPTRTTAAGPDPDVTS